MRRYSLLPFALALGTLGAAVALAITPGTAAAQGGEMHDMMEFPRPIDALDNVWIEELTMLEVRDALLDGTTTALILTGGIEENDPYLTTGKHNHVLRVMGESIARRLENTLVAPIVTIEPGNPERAIHARRDPLLTGDVPGGAARHGGQPRRAGVHPHLPAGRQRRQPARHGGSGRGAGPGLAGS